MLQRQKATYAKSRRNVSVLAEVRASLLTPSLVVSLLHLLVTTVLLSLVLQNYHLGVISHCVISGQACSLISHFKVLYLESLYS